MVVQARAAAAVILLRELEDAGTTQAHSGAQASNIAVFMVRRAARSAFMPDVYVFPGGTVCADDLALESEAQLCASVALSANDNGRTALGSGVRTAAIRELFEEANILLAYTALAPQTALLEIDKELLERYRGYRAALNTRQGEAGQTATFAEMLRRERLVLATDQLHYFAHWITPLAQPRRYDTHFFLARAPLRQEALADQLETSDGLWIRPAEALVRQQEGTFPLAFPTMHQLRTLVGFATSEAAFAAAHASDIATIQPVQVERDGQIQFVISSPSA